jgi:hypothetical protein
MRSQLVFVSHRSLRAYIRATGMPKIENDEKPREFSKRVEGGIEEVIVGTQFLQWVSRGEVVKSANG